jgi:hypothetical protein
MANTSFIVDRHTQNFSSQRSIWRPSQRQSLFRPQRRYSEAGMVVSALQIGCKIFGLLRAHTGKAARDPDSERTTVSALRVRQSHRPTTCKEIQDLRWGTFEEA